MSSYGKSGAKVEGGWHNVESLSDIISLPAPDL